MPTQQDEIWLKHALTLAQQALQRDEVPVGAVLVADGKIIGEGYNTPISSSDPTAHAEIVALRQAAKKIGNYRLIATTLYVTLEPCVMCVGALMHARIQRLVYGAYDQKAGAVVSRCNISELPSNHKIDCLGGVFAQQCAKLLQDFFRVRRCKN
jgi:tRNA(adenine34) deaminase